MNLARHIFLGVCFPLGKGMYRVLHIPVDEAVLLNSREKAPYMICLEVLRCEMPRYNLDNIHWYCEELVVCKMRNTLLIFSFCMFFDIVISRRHPVLRSFLKVEFLWQMEMLSCKNHPLGNIRYGQHKRFTVIAMIGCPDQLLRQLTRQ